MREIISDPFTARNITYNETIVEENGQQRKRLKLQGIFQEAEKPNQNRRVYPRSILEREIVRLQDVIAGTGPIPMSSDHPVAGEDKISQAIAQRVGVSDCAALMTKVYMQGNTVLGECVILDDDGGSGQKIASMIRNGWVPKVSSRGLGGNPTMNETGHYVIPEDYKLLTWDFVSTPSVETAILNQIHEENLMISGGYQETKKAAGNLYQVLMDIRKR